MWVTYHKLQKLQETECKKPTINFQRASLDLSKSRKPWTHVKLESYNFSIEQLKSAFGFFLYICVTITTCLRDRGPYTHLKRKDAYFLIFLT